MFQAREKYPRRMDQEEIKKDLCVHEINLMNFKWKMNMQMLL